MTAVERVRVDDEANLRDILDRWRGSAGFDDTFARHVADARAAVSADLDDSPWND